MSGGRRRYFSKKILTVILLGKYRVRGRILGITQAAAMASSEIRDKKNSYIPEESVWENV